jgi:hypothetical protein
MKLLKIGIILAFIATAVGFYVYNKPHKSIQNASAEIEVEAVQLFAEFATDEQAANEKYLDKIVAVRGRIIEVKQDEAMISVVLETTDMMFGVVCQLDELSVHKRTEFEIGEEVVLKGICTGSLMDVVLVRCVEL